MGALKTVARKIGGSPPFDTFVKLLGTCPTLGTPALRVLMYHRVDELDSRSDLDPSLISATPDQFARQLSWLSRDFDLISGDDLLAISRGQQSFPRRPLLLTFDDAYADFVTHALPTLTRYDAPAVLFVATAYTDGDETAFWWDRLFTALVQSQFRGQLDCGLGQLHIANADDAQRQFKRLKQQLKHLPHEVMLQEVASLERQTNATPPAPAVLGWDVLRSASSNRVMVAPHTHRHPLLDRLSLAEAKREIITSRQRIEEEIGHCPPVFAFPSGHYNAPVTEALRSAGFELGFTTVRGMNHLATDDRLLLRRNNVGRLTPDGLLRAQLIEPARWLRPVMNDAFAPPLSADSRNMAPSLS